MKKCLLVLMFAGFSCSDKRIGKNSETHLNFNTETLTEEECVGEYCASIELEWPVAYGPEAADKINRVVQEELVRHLQLEAPEEKKKDLDTLIQHVIDSFIDYRTDFPNSPAEWFVTEKGKVTYQSDRTLSIRFSHSNYLGGAHGIGFTGYLNLDIRTGELLNPDELVPDRDALLALAEQKFRAFHGVEDGVSLEEDGRFFLEEGRFFLSAAMGFEEEGFRLVYNPYEIAPYAMGATELEFTWEELNGIVRW